MHGKLPANTITAGLDTFSEVRREKKNKWKGNKSKKGGLETKDRDSKFIEK